MTRRPTARLFLAAAFAASAALALGPGRADAATAVLSKNGTLYEVFETTYGQLSPDWPTNDYSSTPILALRTTPPGGASTLELVAGTNYGYDSLGEQIEFDETTQTVFVVYTRLRGFFTDVHVAIRRDGQWAEGAFLPNPGLYVSLNAKLVVTRQTYQDFNDAGKAVTKSRSILSIVWWEESTSAQARYAAIFIEDGALQLSDIVAYDLNTLTSTAGPTDSTGLPQSSYMYPAVQRDLSSNGGIFVSFANLATHTQQVLRIGFPDDYTQPAPPSGTTSGGRTAVGRHTPIGRGYTESAIPWTIDLPFNVAVGTVVSPEGMPTYYWSSGSSFFYV
ncbi:MAG TPA: hypothetical protein VMN04_01950, partial [Thermoanaerobaculia bacterium]|nr:hypothetical protein [Thermoanaerobaculia bacterium]